MPAAAGPAILRIVCNIFIPMEEFPASPRKLKTPNTKVPVRNAFFSFLSSRPAFTKRMVNIGARIAQSQNIDSRISPARARLLPRGFIISLITLIIRKHKNSVNSMFIPTNPMIFSPVSARQ